MIHDTKRLIDVATRDQDANAALLELSHDRLYVLYSSRVDTSGGLARRDKLRIGDKTVSYLSTSTLTSREPITLIGAYPVQTKLYDQYSQPLLLSPWREWYHL